MKRHVQADAIPVAQPTA